MHAGMIVQYVCARSYPYQVCFTPYSRSVHALYIELILQISVRKEEKFSVYIPGLVVIILFTGFTILILLGLKY